jgi:hypothetical protein
MQLTKTAEVTLLTRRRIARFVYMAVDFCKRVTADVLGLYRESVQVEIRLPVGTRECTGTARHAPRSQLYQSFEASTILLGDFQESSTRKVTPELDRSIDRLFRFFDCSFR